jgi:multidrug transporter EmrE-like cation transporter
MSMWTVGLLAALAIACNSGAQMLIKHASSLRDASDAAVSTSGVSLLGGLNPMSLAAALFLYGLSFVLTAFVYARLPLSVASPLMAGATFVLISLGSVFWFQETLTAMHVAGMACIVLGMLLLVQGA